MRRMRERARTTLPATTADGQRPVLDGFAASTGRPVVTGRGNPPAPMPGGRHATAEATRRSVRGLGHVEGAKEKLGAIVGMGLQDEISDEEAMTLAGFDGAAPEPRRTADNLPAVISNAMTVQGEDIVPEWHMVRHLPGYVQSGVRAFGRRVLGAFTQTPIENIQTVTTLTNSEVEVKAMMAWIVRNGVRDEKAELDFSATIPDYRADVQVWSTDGYTFLMVRDFAGHYVYGWPGGRGVHLESDHQPLPLLR